MLLKLCYLYFLASEPDCSSSIHFRSRRDTAIDNIRTHSLSLRFRSTTQRSGLGFLFNVRLQQLNDRGELDAPKRSHRRGSPSGVIVGMILRQSGHTGQSHSQDAECE